MTQNTLPIIAIVGQTASGKSAQAMRLAKELNAEILCADSRTVYKHMDIGTAKPSQNDQAKIKHHGLDLINPNEYYSAAAFQKYANTIVEKATKSIILVGGTGLYIDGFLYNFTFADEPDTETRLKFESMSLVELQKEARRLGIEHSLQNHRHLSRAVERAGQKTTKKALPSNVLLLGISCEQDVLKQRIQNRVDEMFQQGLEQEVSDLIQAYGADAVGLLTPGYKAMRQYSDGELNLEEAKRRFVQNDTRLAKRQKTWFKRNPDIKWCDGEHEIDDYVRAFMHNFDTIES